MSEKSTLEEFERQGWTRRPTILHHPGSASWTKEAQEVAAIDTAGSSVSVPLGLPLSMGAPVGDVYFDGAFVSVSAQEFTGREFAIGLLLEIRAPAGTMYLPMSYPGDGLNEAELLLPRGTSMYVLGVRPPALEPQNGDKTTVHEVVPLPPGASSPGRLEDPIEFARIAWDEYEHIIR